jgi:coenzyme F420-reducing hydrogenase delta subunit/ferredoxin
MSKTLPVQLKPAEAGAVAGEPDWQPDIVAMVCRWCTYAGADLAGTSRLSYPASVRLVRFPCTGRMNPLFILKAFENGADGVLVSGCHPGDCHYVQGNLYARRRFATFKALMEFVGLDPRRLHFSWVSASEGAKWVQVVEQVNEAVQAVGPSKPRGASAAAFRPEDSPSRAPASAEEHEALTGRLRQVAADLLGEGQASLILGYRQGTLPGQVVPGFIARPDEADDLVWDSHCFNNLSVYLPRLERNGDGKVAAVVKKCDAETVVGLLQEGQLEREKLLLVGVQCAGVWEGDRLAAKCHTCDGQVSPLCDVAVTPEGTRQADAEAEGARAVAESDPRDAAIAYLESLPPETRWDFWQEQFARCIRCYACRAACPLCYCETCIVEKHRPQWISPAIDDTGNTAWNIVRAFHLAGRCTGCDECARVCPADIRLDLINRKLVQVVEQRFGYRAGTDLEASPPLTEFRDDDAEEFIR